MGVLKKFIKKKNIKRLRKLQEYKTLKDDVDFVSKKILNLLIDCESLIISKFFFERKEDLKKELINMDSKQESSFKKKTLHINQKAIDLTNNFKIVQDIFSDFKKKLESISKRYEKDPDYKIINLQYTQLETKMDLIKKYRKISNIVFNEK